MYKNLRHQQDSKRIDIHDTQEVRNRCKALVVTADELEEAIEIVGTYAKDVRKFLGK